MVDCYSEYFTRGGVAVKRRSSPKPLIPTAKLGPFNTSKNRPKTTATFTMILAYRSHEIINLPVNHEKSDVKCE